GLVHNDQIVHLRGFGSADQNGRAVTPQTPFVLGSVSKSFTALAVMQQVEAGKVELDAPVQRYLPWFRVADPVASARITVRNLLYHTTDKERPSFSSSSPGCTLLVLRCRLRVVVSSRFVVRGRKSTFAASSSRNNLPR